MKKKICLVLALVLCASTQSNIVNAKDDGAAMLQRYYKERVTADVVNQKDEIEESVAIEKYRRVQNVFSNLEGSKDVDNYGGCFIDDDNNLVVMTADQNKIKRVGIVADRYAMCEYSYDELQATYNELNVMSDKLCSLNECGKISENEKEVLDQLSGFYIYVENNNVTVDLNDNENEKVVEYIKDNVTNPAILEFEEVEDVKNEVTKIKLGQAVKTDYGTISVGIKAYYINSSGTKVHGFITAAHGCEAVGDSVYIGSTKIGQVVKRKYSGKVDAAFVKITNSNYEASRVVYYSNSSGSTSGGVTISKDLYVSLADGAIGDTIYKAGCTTYLTKGKLVSDSATFLINGITFKDLYKSTYNSDNGDSGGVVYYYDSDGYQYLGIHKGSSNYSNGTHYAYTVKWENIDDAWGIYFE